MMLVLNLNYLKQLKMTMSNYLILLLFHLHLMMINSVKHVVLFNVVKPETFYDDVHVLALLNVVKPVIYNDVL
jgi:hypothetical protein